MKILVYLLTLTVLFCGHAADLQQLSNDGKWKELRTESEKILESGADSKRAAEAWNFLVIALERLGEQAAYDPAFEKYVEKKYGKAPLFLANANLTPAVSFGYIRDNKFFRGYNRGDGGHHVQTDERDRVQRLRLYAAALSDALALKDKQTRQDFFSKFIRILLTNRDGNQSQSFKLQTKTDLTTLPDYREAGVWSSSRPPVREDGTPVFYSVPSSWETAKNDGERFRYLCQVSENIRLYAEFLSEQFDFSAVDYSTKLEYQQTEELRQALYDLKENETIAELADGVRKITMPADSDYFAILHAAKAHSVLARLYFERMQMEKAVEQYRLAKDQDAVKRLTGIWGAPSPVAVSAVKAPLAIPYSFRNAAGVNVRLYRVDSGKAVDFLLKNYRENNPTWASRSLFDLPNAMNTWKNWQDVVEKTPYKTFTHKLDTPPHHWMGTGFLPFPETENAGAWLAEIVPVDAQGRENTESTARSLIWIADHTLLNVPGYNGIKFILAESGNGKAVKNGSVTVYQYFYQYGNRRARTKIDVQERVKTYTADEQGIISIPEQDLQAPEGYHIGGRFAISELEKGKLTLLDGFSGGRSDSARQYARPKIYFISDRAIYKPGDTVSITGYIRNNNYDEARNRIDVPESVNVILRDPQRKTVLEKTVPVDAETKSFTLETELAADANLGRWSVQLKARPYSGYLSFTVEEYKKPEYVLDLETPAEPVKCGDKITIRMKAAYFFGAPMAGSKIKYTVNRTEHQQLFPFFFRYSWLFGNRYGICTVMLPLAENDKKHNYRNIGNVMVASGEALTNDNGEFTLTLDTEKDAAVFAGKDFSYSIEASVADATGRVVTAHGSVTAAAVPFRVHIYTPWGFVSTGKPAEIRVKAITADGKDVEGRGVIRIFRKTVKDGVPARTGTVLKSVEFTPGKEPPRVVFDQPGVYDCEAEVVSANGITQKQSATLFVTGEKQSDSIFSEVPLQISTDKPEYKPGETAHLLLSSNREGQIFYVVKKSEREDRIEIVPAKGCSALVSLPLIKEDQPNTFVSVFTVQDGQLHTLTKELYLPPENKMLNVSPVWEKTKAAPGETVPLKLKVTTPDGKPVKGAVTVTVYDKKLDSLARSNVQKIHTFFWNWKRWQTFHYIGINRNTLGVWGNIPIQTYPPAQEGARFFGIKAKGRNAVYARKEAAPMVAESATADSAAVMESGKAASEETEEDVRSDFADRAFWLGTKVLPDNGELTLPVTLPDDLTTWRVRVWSLTPETRVGEGEAELLVSKDLIARLELPRFMVRGDTVTAIVTIHNLSEKDCKGTVKLSAEGLLPGEWQKAIAIPAGKDTVFPVTLTAGKPGEYTLTLTAKTEHLRDALQLKLPVIVKGFDKQVNHCGVLNANDPAESLVLTIPAERRPESTAFALYFTPGAAVAITELLPYLACDDSADTFGIVNRFVPILTAKDAFERLNIPWDFPKTERDALYREYMTSYCHAVPVFNAAEYEKVWKANLAQIFKMQNADGGWGWFSGRGEISYPDTTAYVLDALLDLPETQRNKSKCDSAVQWLTRHADKRVSFITGKEKSTVSNTDCLVVRVLAKAGKVHSGLQALCYKYRVEHGLAPYGFAMLALSYAPETEETMMLMANLAGYWKEDSENHTGYLKIPGSFFCHWFGNENETLAAYLELLLRQDPDDVKAQKLAKYLTVNVRNSPWRNSTRALGAVTRALSKYIVRSGEGATDCKVTVTAGGKTVTHVFNRENLFRNSSSPALFLKAEQLSTGTNRIELRFEGTGTIFWNSMLNYFSLEDDVKPEGLEMKVKRNYYRLVKAEEAVILAGDKGKAVTAATGKYVRIPLKADDILKPQDLLEVELITEAKNDYDYVTVKDAMPAGFEYVAPVSGYQWKFGGSPIYIQYRERGAEFFMRSMARGSNTITYRLRAQLPGKVTALPATGYGVYARELKCNSSQVLLKTEN